MIPRRRVLNLALGLALGLPLARGAQDSRDPDAMLSVEAGAAAHDFGTVRQGTNIEHTFLLTSSGTKPVEIVRATTTCGCTVTEVEVEGEDGTFGPYTWGSPIVPGRHVQLTARIATTRKVDKVHVRIDVAHNGRLGTLQLDLDANIEPLFVTTPGFLNLGDLREREPREGTLDVEVRSGDRVRFTILPETLEILPPGVTLDLSAVEPDADGRSSRWRTNVHVGPDTEIGSLTFTLCLLSDVLVPDPGQDVRFNPPAAPGAHPTRYYQVRTTVAGRVLAPLTLSAPFLLFGVIQPGQAASRSVQLVSNEPDFDLSRVEVGLRGEGGAELPWKDYLTATVRPVEGSAAALEIQLDLAALPAGTQGTVRGELWIRTGHPRCPELSARFSGVCR